MAKVLKEKIERLSTTQILRAWEWTTVANNEQTPTIRMHLMNELERRNPRGFNAWLDNPETKDIELRGYIQTNPMCLNCKRWKTDCLGTLHWIFTGCIWKIIK